jgi:outer membrane protein OmpA-like peptidoglycan-associated protein
MRYRTLLIAACVGLCSTPPTVHAQQFAEGGSRLRADARSIQVYRLQDNRQATFDVRGIAHGDASRGTLEIEYKDGHALMHLRVDSLIHPQRVGAAYSAYVFWGVAVDGKVTRLAELRYHDDIDVKTDLTAQTVGILATAEPYAEVELPSQEFVLTFTLRDRGDKHAPIVSHARYLGDNGALYLDASALPDFQTPLLVLSARHAVAIARRSGAVEFASTEWRQVDVKLGVLEQIWPDQRSNESKFSGTAREVIRMADAARRIGTERSDKAAAEAERTATAARLANAASDVDEAQRLKRQAERDADRARVTADNAYQDAALARASADSANQAAALTLRYADSVRTAATADAAVAQQEAIAARRERDNARARLANSIGAILDTRREARGLVVNLSGVLFTSGQAALQPVARENLSKLTGLLLAYSGPYTLSFDGHTDSVGSDAMNDRLSQARAESVRGYLSEAGIAAAHLSSATGYGKHQPVADNGTAAGRARNRRVEIVINDADLSVR